MEDRNFLPWRKLDNAAHAFPAATDKRDTRVFRFYCQLTQNVEPLLLQKALDETMRKYPVFQTVLRKGLFWYYLEHRDIRAMVMPEEKKPCSRIFIPDEQRLLFEVTYYKERINLEIFHALTDGMGAIVFFRELVKNYLLLAHADEGLTDVCLQKEVNYRDYEEDSFSHYFSRKTPRLWEKKQRAYQISGPKVEKDDIQITEIAIPVEEIKTKAHNLGVSLTVFLTTVMLCAIRASQTAAGRKSILSSAGRQRPITLMVPINLRSYFPSQSMTNFWGWLEIGYRFDEQTQFSDVLAHVKAFFEKELVKERVQMRMNDYIRLEKNRLLRMVPLDIKNIALQAGVRIRDQDMTAVISNVGQIRMPQEYMSYIRRFGVFTNTNRLQLTFCSYADELMLGFSSKFVDLSIQENFTRILAQQGVSCEMIENTYPASRKTSGTEKQYLAWSGMIALLLVVLCILLDIVILPGIVWSPAACGIIGCLWLCSALGYLKRRNILKGMMWQLLVGIGLCIVWDGLTGWHGWSVDIVFPLYTMLVLAGMYLTVHLLRLETVECLIYFLMASCVGLIPGVLCIYGSLYIRLPSVLCNIFCLLSLIRIMIFRFPELKLELVKKLHL